MEFCIYLPPGFWQTQFASVRGWSGGGSLKNACHCSAKGVRKENLIYFNGFSSLISGSVCLSASVNSELNFKRLFFQRGCLLKFTVKVGCCPNVVWLCEDQLTQNTLPSPSLAFISLLQAKFTKKGSSRHLKIAL